MVEVCGFVFPKSGDEIGPRQSLVRYVPFNFLAQYKDKPRLVRLSSSTFMPSSGDGACSVNWYEAMRANDESTDRIWHKGDQANLPFSLKIGVSELHRHGLGVIYDPAGDDVYHCAIVGYSGHRNADRRMAKGIIQAANFEWLVPPPNIYP